MEKQYYIPGPEEFHIGFEYQVNASPSDSPYETLGSWLNVTHPKNPFVGERVKAILESECRVKYLDQEDIESFGFNYYATTIDKWYKLIKDCQLPMSNYRNRMIILRHDFRSNQGVIISGFEFEGSSDNEEVLYRGRCRNKSELNTILISIGIKTDYE